MNKLMKANVTTWAGGFNAVRVIEVDRKKRN